MSSKASTLRMTEKVSDIYELYQAQVDLIADYEARCAAMRGALEGVLPLAKAWDAHCDFNSSGNLEYIPSVQIVEADAALSDDAGARILAALEK